MRRWDIERHIRFLVGAGRCSLAREHLLERQDTAPVNGRGDQFVVSAEAPDVCL